MACTWRDRKGVAGVDTAVPGWAGAVRVEMNTLPSHDCALHSDRSKLIPCYSTIAHWTRTDSRFPKDVTSDVLILYPNGMRCVACGGGVMVAAEHSRATTVTTHHIVVASTTCCVRMLALLIISLGVNINHIYSTIRIFSTLPSLPVVSSY